MKRAIIFILVFSSFASCKNDKMNTPQTKSKVQEQTNKEFKLSLAQWSLHRAFENGELNPFDFASKAAELGFEGIEYVGGFYKDHVLNSESLDLLKEKAEKANVEQLLIMVDGEGDLASLNEGERDEAVENHKKWVDAAKYLGCHSIRVNLFGEPYDVEKWKNAAVLSLRKLSEFGRQRGINILVENHGYLSSNGAALAEVIQKVNRPNCGTLPDFGNFCLKRENGEKWGKPCIDEYDKYKGVEELMPYAKAVSAKSYDFDNNGNETSIDYAKMIEIVRSHKYQGFIGVEYEGDRLGEEEGIIMTKNLLLKQFN